MKSILVILLSVISLSAFSQTAKKQSFATPKEEPKTITITLTESQMVNVYTLLNSGKAGLFDSNQLTARGAKELSVFADSLNNVFILQSQKWHPEPVKKDSTGKK